MTYPSYRTTVQILWLPVGGSFLWLSCYLCFLSYLVYEISRPAFYLSQTRPLRTLRQLWKFFQVSHLFLFSYIQEFGWGGTSQWPLQLSLKQPCTSYARALGPTCMLLQLAALKSGKFSQRLKWNKTWWCTPQWRYTLCCVSFLLLIDLGCFKLCLHV